MRPELKPPLWIVLGFASLHVALRLLSPHLHYFWETDDPAIAAGVAALLTDSPGDAYRYAPQAGYYRLVEAITWLLGSRVSVIPNAMIGLSVAAGIAVPLLALGTFPRELGLRERFAWALVLAANPILYWSGRYGNTAMPSIALIGASFFCLSRARSLRGEIAGLAFFGAAIWVRADAALVGPALALWLWQRHGSLRAVAGRLIGFGAVLAAFYAALWVLDPRMSKLASEVASHLTSPVFLSHFWDYLVLAFSPIPVFLAIWGMRGMLDARPRLLALVGVWCAMPAAFYFLTLTTPRYFLALVLPVGLCGALAALELIDRGARLLPRAIVVLAVAGLAGLHLLVPLDRLSPRFSFAVFETANDMTHDGPMHTGGFLYHGLLRGGWLRWSWAGGAFGEDAKFASVSRAALGALAASGSPKRVFVAVRGFPDCAFYYEIYRSGGIVTEVMPAAPGAVDLSHTAPTRWAIGPSELITANPNVAAFSLLASLPLGVGDEIWFTHDEDESVIAAKLSPGLAMEPIGGPGSPFQARRVVLMPAGESP